MQASTDAEVLSWLKDIVWNHGIKADETNLYYAEPSANCMEMKFPETPLRVSYFSRFASMLGSADEALFYGALLWITNSSMGSPQLVKAGWKLVERMRQGCGENRPLETARGHFSRDDEIVDLNAFLVPCFVYGWDAYVIFNASNDFFVYISHDLYWGVVARTQEAYDRLFSELKDLNPVESPGMRKQFCRTMNGPDQFE